MNARCGICLDDLTANIYATQCGHLYCEECATFQFTLPSAACAICRRSHTFEELVRLYPDFEADTRPGSSRPAATTQERVRRMADALGRAAVADCEDLVERGCEGSERAGIVLSRVDNFLKALPDDGRLPRLQEMLQSLNELLAQIRSGLPNAHRLRKLEVDYERRRGDMRGLRSQLKDVIRERDQDRKGFKEEQRLQREAWAREKAALRSRLEMLTRELGAERANAQEVELAKNTTDAEKRQWMLSATRYKKKYYALKAQISARNRFKASGGESDDSLEVVS